MGFSGDVYDSTPRPTPPKSTPKPKPARWDFGIGESVDKSLWRARLHGSDPQLFAELDALEKAGYDVQAKDYAQAWRGLDYNPSTGQRILGTLGGGTVGSLVGSRLGAAGGAALSGALLGSAVGPIGTALGAIGGTVGGLVLGNQVASSFDPESAGADWTKELLTAMALGKVAGWGGKALKSEAVQAKLPKGVKDTGEAINKLISKGTRKFPKKVSSSALSGATPNPPSGGPAGGFYPTGSPFPVTGASGIPKFSSSAPMTRIPYMGYNGPGPTPTGGGSFPVGPMSPVPPGGDPFLSIQGSQYRPNFDPAALKASLDNGILSMDVATGKIPSGGAEANYAAMQDYLAKTGNPLVPDKVTRLLYPPHSPSSMGDFLSGDSYADNYNTLQRILAQVPGSGRLRVRGENLAMTNSPPSMYSGGRSWTGEGQKFMGEMDPNIGRNIPTFSPPPVMPPAAAPAPTSNGVPITDEILSILSGRDGGGPVSSPGGLPAPSPSLPPTPSAPPVTALQTVPGMGANTDIGVTDMKAQLTNMANLLGVTPKEFEAWRAAAPSGTDPIQVLKQLIATKIKTRMAIQEAVNAAPQSSRASQTLFNYIASRKAAGPTSVQPTAAQTSRASQAFIDYLARQAVKKAPNTLPKIEDWAYGAGQQLPLF